MVNIMAFNQQMPYILSTVLTTLSLFSFHLHKL